MDVKAELLVLKELRSCFKEIVDAISPAAIGYTELTSVIGPILLVNLTSLDSIILLSQNRHYRDAIVLSRPFLDAVANIGYICCKGQKGVMASKKYAYQRGYRDLFQGIGINDFSIKNYFSDHQAEYDKAAPVDLHDAIREYTTKGKSEVKKWTPESTEMKVEAIGKKYGEYVNNLLSFAYFTIYRDVSEIIHNSYYGVMIFTGMQQKDVSAFKDSQEAASYFASHQEKLIALVLQQVNISVVALLSVLAQEFQKDSIIQIFNKANDTLVRYANAVKTKD